MAKKYDTIKVAMGGSWKERVKRETKEERSRHFLGFIKDIRTWHLILVLIPLLFIAATLLRFDHLKMNDLKVAVLEADAAGEDEEGNIKAGEIQKSQEEINQNISNALKELKTFTESHIILNFVEKNGTTSLSFGTGSFYLEHQYKRLATKALEEAEKMAAEISDDNPNGNVYAYANSVCRPQAIKNGWRWNSAEYIACMTGEINKYPVSDYITERISASIPSTALFRYDFASPVFAPTLSGFAILICVILIIIILIRIITWLILKIALLFLK